MEAEAKHGSLKKTSGGTEILMQRIFAYPVAQVWAYLTEPSLLAQWLAPGKIESRVGGVARLDFSESGITIDSLVTEDVLQQVVAYSWSGPGEPSRPLRFSFHAVPDGTCLVLTLHIPDGEDAPRAAAGFEAHLEMLAAALEGVPIKFPFALFKELRSAYQQSPA